LPVALQLSSNCAADVTIIGKHFRKFRLKLKSFFNLYFRPKLHFVMPAELAMLMFRVSAMIVESLELIALKAFK